MKIILQKYIADSGYSSRRQAEDLIRRKKVSVNKVRAELGMKVDDRDEVFVEGKKIGAKKENIYIALNKPMGYTCTNRKFANEKNVFDIVKSKERLFVVGRLDKDSQGLLLLTNDGDLSQEMTHPSYESEKKYLVEVEKIKIEPQRIIKSFLKGVDIGRDPSTNSGRKGDGIVWVKGVKHLGGKKFEIILIEGKKRQIRRMFESLGMKVEKLKRTSMGKLSINNLKEGQYKEIEKKDII